MTRGTTGDTLGRNPGVKKPHERIPSLDGLRAVSILIVLLGHIEGTRGANFSIPGDNYANFGVRVFFVISGYLITTLLFEELQRSRTISLKAFYLRRTFRIFPAFYAYLAVVALLTLFNVATTPMRDVAIAASYTINFVAHKDWLVGHIWSLSVEEQFYLLWPAALFFLGKARGLKVAGAMLLIAPGCRLAWFHVSPGTQTLITEAFPCVADAIAAGCVLAGVRDRLGQSPRYLRAIRSPIFWLLPVLLLLVNEAPYYRLRWLVFESIMNVGIAVIVDRAIRFPTDWVGRALNHRSFVFVGSLSYSLYLWQQPFLNARGTSVLNAFPTNLGCSVAAALASYYLIEKPFLALRPRPRT
jgi:peptidoglycan/LPS O-acetylase OafA/YrhL